MDQSDGKALPSGVIHRLHGAGAKVPVVVIHRQQTVGVVHHVLVSQLVIGHRVIFRSSGDDYLRTVLPQNR